MTQPALKMLKANLFEKEIELAGTRDGYGEGLVELGEKNLDIVVLTGDLSESTRAHKFEEKYPDRFIECGVAEQNMVGIAAGLALSGKIPFVSSYAVFVPGRCWDQVRVSVAYSNANVKIAGAHAGISVGPDGATHQALEDVASMRALPNMVVIVPCDKEETRKATLAAAEHKGPVYFRFEREKTEEITTKDTPFKIGQAEVFKKGADVTIVACGPPLYKALVAAHELEKAGVGVEVINSHTIKPLDEVTLTHSARKTGCVVTVEDHQVTGGLGGAVAETLARNFPVPIRFVGVQDHFGESGQPEYLLKKFGLSVENIKDKVKEVIRAKKEMWEKKD